MDGTARDRMLEGTARATREGPLAGLRVLDLTRLLPGGYCTLLLADLGADVVKVEEPGRGDYLRWMPPLEDGESLYHRALNRGKRSVTINLKAPSGVGLAHRLAETADVLVESFRPGVLDRLGLGFERLRERNAGLVYCAITGYGQGGPYRDRPGHDINYIGYAGMLDLIGEEAGPPVVPGVQIGDIGGGGMAAAIGILSAVVERARTGHGRFVDTAMLDGVVSWLSIHAGAFFGGLVPRRGAMRLSGGYACYRVYRCADGKYVSVGALESQFWTELCHALGTPEFIEIQFSDPHQSEIASRLQDIFATRNRDEWVSELAPLETCVGPVNDLAEAFGDPQVVHRELVAEVDGRRVGPSSPFRFDGEHAAALRPAPALGEHTADILGELGLDEEQLSDLRAGGVV